MSLGSRKQGTFLGLTGGGRGGPRDVAAKWGPEVPSPQGFYPADWPRAGRLSLACNLRPQASSVPPPSPVLLSTVPSACPPPAGLWCYSTPSMKLVSRCWMSTRRKDISLRVFSKMMRGSSDRQRRQLGAITMARLLTSILVMATLAGCTNT